MSDSRGRGRRLGAITAQGREADQSSLPVEKRQLSSCLVGHRGGHGTLLDAMGTRGLLPPRVADHTPVPAGWCATATASCAMGCPVDRCRRRGSCLLFLVEQLPLAPVRPVLGLFLPCLVDVWAIVSLAVPVSTVSDW